MTPDARPAIVAYDGSEPAVQAIRAAAALLTGRALLVVTVWEPGLAMMMAPGPDLTGLAHAPPSAEEMATVDRAEHDVATATAEAGTHLARELGADAAALAIADEADAAETIAALADRRDACAIVVGSRGLGRIASAFGSTSRELLRRSSCPVIVVRAPR